MTSPITITIEGVPIAKGRARFGKLRVYTPAATRGFARSAGWQALTAMNGRMPMTEPVRLEVEFHLPVSDRWTAKRKGGALLGMPTGRPDLDNLVKGVCDAFNKIVFNDDAQIVELIARKRFSLAPKLVATITPLSST